MTTTGVASRSTEACLKAVFGDRVPADGEHAIAMLEQSPLRPQDPVALQAVREAVLDAAARELGHLTRDGYQIRARPSSSTTQGPLSLLLQEKTRPLDPVVSLARAHALFDELARAPDIPHGFVDEGCHYRAHVMARRLEEQGVYSEKVLLRPTSGADLQMHSDKTPLGYTLCIFHIAPCVLVKGDDGEPRRMVIDPSLFDRPVAVDEWAKKMNALDDEPCETFVLPRFAFHLSDRYNPPTSWQAKDLEEAAAWNTQYKEAWDYMKESGFYDSLKEMVAEAKKERGA